MSPGGAGIRDGCHSDCSACRRCRVLSLAQTACTIGHLPPVQSTNSPTGNWHFESQDDKIELCGTRDEPHVSCVSAIGRFWDLCFGIRSQILVFGWPRGFDRRKRQLHLVEHSSETASCDLTGILPATIHVRRHRRIDGLFKRRCRCVYPPDLEAGDSYHLVFVTRGVRDTTQGDVGVYDAFVNDEVSLSDLTRGASWAAHFDGIRGRTRPRYDRGPGLQPIRSVGGRWIRRHVGRSAA